MKKLSTVCRNPWCKAPFFYTEDQMVDNRVPKICNKCGNFDNEVSGGVEWNDVDYDEPLSSKGDKIIYNSKKL